MYMSRIILDTANRRTLQALNEPKLFHGALENAYSGERIRNLWRLDWQGDQCAMLVVSGQRLDLSSLAAQFATNDVGAVKTLDYQPFLDRLEQGGRWRFRLCANPVVAAKNGEGRGKLHAHVSEYYQRQWLLERAHKHGFSVKDDELAVVGDRWLIFGKRGMKDGVRIRQVTFSGILEITDVQQFRLALCGGIGKGKAYGCGLLTIASI